MHNTRKLAILAAAIAVFGLGGLALSLIHI